MGVKCVVTKRAYYGNRLLEKGMTLDFPGKADELPSWLEQVGGKSKPAPKKTTEEQQKEAEEKAKADAKAKAEQEAAKNAGASGQANPAKVVDPEAKAAAEAAAAAK